MPVFGLPTALESSLNSLVDLRPPTSWRVSGHGRQEVTVVVRWTLHVSSPSSEKTLHYDEVETQPTPAAMAELDSDTVTSREQKNNCPVLIDKCGKNLTKIPILSLQNRKLQLLSGRESQSNSIYSQENTTNYQDTSFNDLDAEESFPVQKKKKCPSGIPYRLYRNPSYSSSNASFSNRGFMGQDERYGTSKKNKTSCVKEKQKSAFRTALSIGDSPDCRTSSASRLDSLDKNDIQDVCHYKEISKENWNDSFPHRQNPSVPTQKNPQVHSQFNKQFPGFHHIEAEKISRYAKKASHVCHTPRPLYAKSDSNMQLRYKPENEDSIYLSFSPLNKQLMHTPISLQDGDVKGSSNDDITYPKVVIDIDGDHADNDRHNCHGSHSDHKKVYTQMKAVQQIAFPSHSNTSRPQTISENSTDHEKNLRNGIRAYLAQCGSGDSNQLKIYDFVNNDDSDDAEDVEDDGFDKNSFYDTVRVIHDKIDADEKKRDNDKNKAACDRLDERSGTLYSLEPDEGHENVQHSRCQVFSKSSALFDKPSDQRKTSNHLATSFQKEYISSIEKHLTRRMQRQASIDCDNSIAIENGDKDVLVTNLCANPKSSCHSAKEHATKSPLLMTANQQENVGSFVKDSSDEIDVCEQGMSLEDCECRSELAVGFENKEGYSFSEEKENIICKDNEDNNFNMTVSTSESTYCLDERSNGSDQLEVKDFCQEKGLVSDESSNKENTGTCGTEHTRNEKPCERIKTLDKIMVTEDEEDQANKIERSNVEGVNSINVIIVDVDTDLPKLSEEKAAEKEYEKDSIKDWNRKEKGMKGNKGDCELVVITNELVHSPNKANSLPDDIQLDKKIDGQCPDQKKTVGCEKSCESGNDGDSESQYLIDLSQQEECAQTESQDEQASQKNNDGIILNNEGEVEWRSEANVWKDQENITKSDNDNQVMGNLRSFSTKVNNDTACPTSSPHHQTLSDNSEMVKKSPHRSRSRRHIYATKVRHASESPPLFYPSRQNIFHSEAAQTIDFPSLSNHAICRKLKRPRLTNQSTTPSYESPSKSRKRSHRNKTKVMKTNWQPSNRSVIKSLNEKDALQDEQNSMSSPPASIVQSSTLSDDSNAFQGSVIKEDNLYQSPKALLAQSSCKNISSLRIGDRISNSPVRSRSKCMSQKIVEVSSTSLNKRHTPNEVQLAKPNQSKGDKSVCSEQNEYSFSVISQSPQVSLLRIDHKISVSRKTITCQESHDSDCPAYNKQKLRKESESLSDSAEDVEKYTPHISGKSDISSDGHHTKINSDTQLSHSPSQRGTEHDAAKPAARKRRHHPWNTTQSSHNSDTDGSVQSSPTLYSTKSSTLHSPPHNTCLDTSSPHVFRKTPVTETSIALNSMLDHPSTSAQQSEDNDSVLEINQSEKHRKDTFDISSIASSPVHPPTESPLGFACESFEHLPVGIDVKLDDSSSDEASIRPPTPFPDV